MILNIRENSQLVTLGKLIKISALSELGFMCMRDKHTRSTYAWNSWKFSS